MLKVVETFSSTKYERTNTTAPSRIQLTFHNSLNVTRSLMMKS